MKTVTLTIDGATVTAHCCPSSMAAATRGGMCQRFQSNAKPRTQDPILL